MLLPRLIVDAMPVAGRKVVAVDDGANEENAEHARLHLPPMKDMSVPVAPRRDSIHVETFFKPEYARTCLRGM